MSTSVYIHPFCSLPILSVVTVDSRDTASPQIPEPPAPPEPAEDPGEPEREYPCWTYFIENPRPNVTAVYP
jgi:hypothetical protein